MAVGLFSIDHAQVVHTVGQITTMVALVRAGRGVAFVPASARLLGVDGVQYIGLNERARGAVKLHVIWNQGNSNPALQRVLGLLDAEVEG